MQRRVEQRSFELVSQYTLWRKLVMKVGNFIPLTSG